MAQFVCRARRNDGGVWRDIVDDTDRASRYQHAERFADESAYLAKMMRGEAAHDEIEAASGKSSALAVRALTLARLRALSSLRVSASISSVKSVAVTLAT